MRVLSCVVFLLACANAVAAAPLDGEQAAQLKADVAGEYRLDTGRSVRLWLIEQRLYIDLNQSYRKELEAVAPNLLASRDGLVTVHYLADGDRARIRIQHARYPSTRPIGELRWSGY